MSPARPLLAVLAATALISSTEATRILFKSSIKAYETFRRDVAVPRSAGDDAVNYRNRAVLFQERREAVRKHNAKSGKLWVASVNKFADFTETEFQALLGHRPGEEAHRPAQAAATVSLLEVQPMHETLAKSIDWRHTLNASTQPKDQGACGSCWAVASAGALETHAEITGSPIRVSYEHLVDCVPNPQKCGGSGGCEGATAELAFEFVRAHGVASAADYRGYQSGGNKHCKPVKNAALVSDGFVRLPVNKLQPLLEAVSTKGPVVVSADASGWGSYASGIFHECERDAVVNHAILMMGYGRDTKLKRSYWIIRNSWGADWGEAGYIRLLRHPKDSGKAGWCGTDRRPLDGVGCKGGPKELPVCGMCGVLSDSAYPTGVRQAAAPQTTKSA